MRIRRPLLVLLLGASVLSATSSAYRSPGRQLPQSHAMHMAQSAQNGFATLPAFGNPRDAKKRTTVIDGAKTPELIPDDLAYRHFIRATASSASAMDVERREVFLKEAGLNAADREAYRLALGNAAEELKSVAELRKARGPSQSTSSLAALRHTEDEALSAARSRIDTALSLEGQTKLATHIRQNVKRRIKMFSSPMTK